MTLQSDWEILDAALQQLAEARNHRTLREEFLQRVEVLFRYDLAVFDLSRIEDDQFINLYDPVVYSRFDAAFERTFLQRYDEQFYRTSYTRWIHFEQRAITYSETDLISDRMREKSHFFKNYLQPCGLVYCCGCNLFGNGLNQGALTFYRTVESGDFGRRSLTLLRLLQPHIVAALADCRATGSGGIGGEDSLSPREVEIVRLTCQGMSNGEIAASLYISISTVKKHLHNIFSKLGIKSRAQLMALKGSR